MARILEIVVKMQIDGTIKVYTINEKPLGWGILHVEKKTTENKQTTEYKEIRNKSINYSWWMPKLDKKKHDWDRTKTWN